MQQFYAPMAQIKRFFESEDGAVTVDWVVLTASVVGLGLIVISIVNGALIDENGTAIAESIAAARDQVNTGRP
jgi:hypothetical protein